METDSTRNGIHRRDFLVRSAKAGLCVAAACALGYGFHDPIGPARHPSRVEAVHFPDYSIHDMGAGFCVVRGKDRVKTVRLALKALGGMEAFIRKGDRVLLKVNAAFATPAMLSATSHPALVGELVRLCFASGASSVVVADNPINDPAVCFALTGIAGAAESAGARVLPPKERYFSTATVPGARLIVDWPVFHEPLKLVDKVIGVAPVKDHHRSGASMSMKNWYGLLGGRRNVFHQDIHNIIKELAVMVKPTLVILDGTTTMMTNGPTGGSLSDLKQTDTMIVSTDQVAADAYGATLLGKTWKDLPFIGKARDAGVGSADFRDLKPGMIQSG
jgi:uncharacterized protein (DUF362 family)